MDIIASATSNVDWVLIVSGNRRSVLECQGRDYISGWLHVEQSAHPQTREIFKEKSEPIEKSSGTREMPVLSFQGKMESHGA